MNQYDEYEWAVELAGRHGLGILPNPQIELDAYVPLIDAMRVIAAIERERDVLRALYLYPRTEAAPPDGRMTDNGWQPWSKPTVGRQTFRFSLGGDTRPADNEREQDEATSPGG